MATRRLSGMATSSSVPDNGGGSGGEPEGTYTDDVFSTFLYTGTGSTQTITNGIDLSGEGGLVWLKNRPAAGSDHYLFDTERGNNVLLSSNNNAGNNAGWASSFEFNNNGFDAGSIFSTNTENYASWTFGKAKKFFDCVMYTGTGVAREIPHNLGVEPGMIIVKNITSSANWFVWHTDVSGNGPIAGNGSYAYLNSTNEFNAGGTSVFVEANMTSSTFGVGTDEGANGVSGDEYVAYVFAHDETDSGQIQCGSYTGSAGHFVDLGWEPQWVMIKKATGSSPAGWYMFDNMRGAGGSGVKSPWLHANTADAEIAHLERINFNSTGFTLPVDDGDVIGSDTYIYMAVRRKNKPRPPVGYYTDDVFSTYLYEATGEYSDIVNGIDLAGEGGMVWSKSRSQAFDHGLTDTERGVAGGLLQPHESYPAQVAPEGLDLTSYNSNGYSFGPKYTASYNQAGDDYVSWTFRKAPLFFDMVTHTGTAVAENITIPHNLGTTPGMIIYKDVGNAGAWYVWHRDYSYPLDNYQILNQTNGVEGNLGDGIWGFSGASGVTSTGFSINGNGSLNTLNNEYIAYVFAHDDHEDGYIQCGTYTGNGNTDGPEIDLGWEPQWLMIKRSSDVSGWYIMDNMRGLPVDGPANNTATPSLQAQEANSEGTSTNSDVDINATGFQCTTDANGSNANGSTYIYMAIRRPNKPAEEFEAEELFAIDSRQAPKSDPRFFSGFPVDFAFRTQPATSDPNSSASRLTGPTELVINTDAGERSRTQNKFDYMDGYAEGDYDAWYSWMWRRAPGFFDVVAYSAYGLAVMDVPHNLGVEPEMMWIKNRTQNRDWQVYSKAIGNTHCLRLNSDASSQGPSQLLWNNTSPTDSVFTVGDNPETNANPEEFISYLFASVPGICSIGSYTGTGAQFDVDCGFTNGCRFLLIKRTDGTGGWYYWDSLRGINSNNGFQNIPYLLLNDTSAQVMDTFITTTPAGFRVLLSVSANKEEINADGGEYIYMAIA